MRLMHLIVREIAHRRMNFLMGLLAVVVAAGVVVGAITALRAHARQTHAFLDAQRLEVEAGAAALEEEMRKITRDMGFNVVIIPKGQDLTDFYTDQFASRFMPEDYAQRLADAQIITVNHLLPALEQRVRWPERDDRLFILIGIRGQVPMTYREERNPIQHPVARGAIILGHELARAEQLKLGDTVQLMGRAFKVTEIYRERGDRRDITAWIDLDTAQTMLDKQGLINSIWALECRCAWADLPKVRAEIASILPDTQVIEQGTIALARAEARYAAERNRVLQLEQEQTRRLGLLGHYHRLTAMLMPVVIGAAVIWVATLTLLNVRQRRGEIALCRALGAQTPQIIVLVLARVVLLGFVGALLGYGLGWLGARGIFESTAIEHGPFFDPILLLTLLIAAPLLCALAGWLPALSAATQDPADVLREE